MSQKKGRVDDGSPCFPLFSFKFFVPVHFSVRSLFSHIGSFFVLPFCSSPLNERVFVLLMYSGCGSLFGYSTSLAALFVHRFRHPLPDYAHHQRVPLLGHDLLLFQDRSHRKGAQHHRRV